MCSEGWLTGEFLSEGGTARNSDLGECATITMNGCDQTMYQDSRGHDVPSQSMGSYNVLFGLICNGKPVYELDFYDTDEKELYTDADLPLPRIFYYSGSALQELDAGWYSGFVDDDCFVRDTNVIISTDEGYDPALVVGVANLTETMQCEAFKSADEVEEELRSRAVMTERLEGSRCFSERNCFGSKNISTVESCSWNVTESSNLVFTSFHLDGREGGECGGDVVVIAGEEYCGEFGGVDREIYRVARGRRGDVEGSSRGR